MTLIYSCLTFIMNIVYTLLLLLTLLSLKLLAIPTKCIFKIIYYYTKLSKKITKNTSISNETISIPIQFIYTKMHTHGFYTSIFIINNQTKQISTFFPSDWTEELVIKAIRQAL